MIVSVLDRIKQDHRGAEILSLLLGTEIREGKTTAIRCLRPALHKNGDKHPSCVCKPDAVRLDCPCGLGLGLFDIVVEKGFAADQKEAAKWLEERLYPTTNGNGHHPPEEWPWFPKTAKDRLGWTVSVEDGVKVIHAQTFAHDGTPGKVKRRYEKGKGKPTGMFDGEGVVGLLGLDRAASALEESENPKVAILCGETDLLAWTYHAADEGIAIPGVSHSAGEGSSFQEFLTFFKGVDVLYVADNDDAGRKGAEARRREIAPVAKSFTVLFPPAGKDACDYLRMGGSVRAMLRQAEEAQEKATPEQTSWDLTETLSREPPDPPEELVEGLFTRPSVNVVYGPPSSGKSWAVMALCLEAILGGGSFLGCQDIPVFPRRTDDGSPDERVLWVFGSEDTPRRIERRLRILLGTPAFSGRTIAPGTFVYATPPAGVLLGTPQGDQWLDDVRFRHNPTIMVLDTIASLSGDSVDALKAECVVPFMRRLHALRDLFNLTIFPLHHTRKESGDPKKSKGARADAMLGSQAWRSMADSCLMVDAIDGDVSDVTVRLVKSKDLDQPQKPFHAAFSRGEWSFLRWDSEEDALKPKRVLKGSAEHVLTLRPEHPDGIEVTKIRAALNIGKATWNDARQNTIKNLLSMGHTVVGGILKWGEEKPERF